MTAECCHPLTSLLSSNFSWVILLGSHESSPIYTTVSVYGIIISFVLVVSAIWIPKRYHDQTTDWCQALADAFIYSYLGNKWGLVGESNWMLSTHLGSHNSMGEQHYLISEKWQEDA